MAAIDQTRANNWLDASVATASYVALTSPMKVRLMTANGTSTSAGTEVSGGSYVSQTVTFASASTGSAASNVTLNYTSMPATTVVGLEIWDSTGTPKRVWFGALSSSKTTNSGDTFQIPSASLTIALS